MRAVALLILTTALIAASSGERRDRVAAEARQAAARGAAFVRAADAARDRAAAARAEQVRLAAAVQDAERALLAAEADARDRRATAARLEARLARERAPIVALAGGLQSLARRPATLAVLQPGSIADQVHLRAALATMLPAVERRTAELRRHVAAARRARHRADAATAGAGRARATLTAASGMLARAERAASRQANAAGQAARTEAERVLALGEQVRALTMSAEDEVRGTATLASLATLPPPSPRPGAVHRPLRAIDAYQLPVIGTLVSGFGERGAAGQETGLTFRVRPHALVVAPAAGTVRHAAPFRSYGGVVVIDHGGGWISTLTGLGAIGRKTGDRVAAGMAVGQAGGDDRPLTVELRRDGRAVDPAPLVSRR